MTAGVFEMRASFPLLPFPMQPSLPSPLVAAPPSLSPHACARRTQEACYEGLQPASISAPDSNLVAANSKYFAVAWKGGGGPFVVYPLACTGKMETVVNKEVMPPAVINGHSMPVQDLDFSPFHASVIASASEDSSVRVWNFEGKIDPASPLAGRI
jgi:hypothetical protein